jgi:glycine betaine/proline transport system substrate-binding protein
VTALIRCQVIVLVTLATAVLGRLGAVEPSQAAGPGNDREVRAARPTWDTGYFYTEIYLEALRQLGYKTAEVKTLDNPIFYQAVSQGDIDLWMEGYFPTHNEYKKLFEGKARPIGYVIKGGSLQGYLVDKKAADANGIKYLEDFSRPEIAELFDGQGTGKADLVACPPGWGCELLVDFQLKAYGLDRAIHTIKAAYNVAMADAVARFKEGKPIFFYTWTPNWTVGLLKPGRDVVWLETKSTKLPESLKEYSDRANVPNVEGCASNPCHMGMPSSDIRPVANEAFLAKNPAVARFLEVVSIPLEDVLKQNGQMNAGQNKSDDIKRHAQEWIRSHQAQFDGWLSEGRNAAK